MSGRIVLIAAVARNRAIGRGGSLIWHEPLDQQHFRRVTMGHPVIMGRKTWDSLPARFRPLPGRRNIVVSRQPGLPAPGAQVAPSLDAAVAMSADADDVFVIGGAALYAQALPRADELLLTEIDADLDGDTSFPRWDRAAFVERSREVHVSADGVAFAFVSYLRRNDSTARRTVPPAAAG